MKLTIKELADELSISKTAINKKVSANLKRKHFSKIGNKFVIDEEGQKLIKSMFTDRHYAESKTKTPNIEFDVSDLVSVLNNQILSTEKQLQEKDKQLSAMQKLLDQQQVLTLQANRKILALETSLEEKNKDNSVSEEHKKAPSEHTESTDHQTIKFDATKKKTGETSKPLSNKKGFFSRWFN